MSDMGGIPAPLENFNILDSGGGNEPAPAAQPSAAQISDYAAGVLRGVDPADRAIVEKYISNWDSGVNRRFQEIHDTYRPYKELNMDYDSMMKARDVWNMIGSDPRQVYQSLKEFLDEQDAQQQQEQQRYDGVPQEFLTEFQQMKQLLTQMGGQFVQSQQQQQEATEDHQLDQYLEALREHYGNFDETYVLSRMSAGMDGPEAVQAYREFEDGIRGQVSVRPMFRPISGGGSVGNQNTFDPRKASARDVKDFVAQSIAAARMQELQG